MVIRSPSSIDHLVARLPAWDETVEKEATAVIEEATENGKLITNDPWNKKQWKETKRPINCARIEHLSSLPREERERVGVAITTATSKLMIEHSHRCAECAMKKKLCVCDELRSMRPMEDERLNLNFEIAVYMHAKERYRASNTGKVLEKLYDARIYVDSVVEDMQALQEAIDAHKSRCCVLFPSTESKTVEELRSEGEASQAAHCEGNEKLLIILVDGTWKQAKRLQKRIDHSVPRVRLMPTTLSRFLCRTQSQADRVCTVEAAALLVSELGYPTEEHRLLMGLEVVVRAFNLQTFGTPYRPDDRHKRRKPHLCASYPSLPPRPASLKDIDQRATQASFISQHSETSSSDMLLPIILAVVGVVFAVIFGCRRGVSEL